MIKFNKITAILIFIILILLGYYMNHIIHRDSALNIYAISDRDIATQYANGTIGDSELKAYFNSHVKHLLVSLNSNDINSINISKPYKKFNKKFNYYAEVKLNRSGVDKIEILNKNGIKNVSIITFGSDYMGTFILMEKIEDAFVMTVHPTEVNDYMKFFKKLCPNVKEEG